MRCTAINEYEYRARVGVDHDQCKRDATHMLPDSKRPLCWQHAKHRLYLEGEPVPLVTEEAVSHGRGPEDPPKLASGRGSEPKAVVAFPSKETLERAKDSPTYRVRVTDRKTGELVME